MTPLLQRLLQQRLSTVSQDSGHPVMSVARGGVEPPTFRFSGGRSYQLSYLA